MGYKRMFFFKIRCVVCRKFFEATRPHTQTCSTRCRKVKSRGTAFLYPHKATFKWRKN